MISHLVCRLTPKIVIVPVNQTISIHLSFDRMAPKDHVLPKMAVTLEIARCSALTLRDLCIPYL